MISKFQRACSWPGRWRRRRALSARRRTCEASGLIGALVLSVFFIFSSQSSALASPKGKAIDRPFFFEKVRVAFHKGRISQKKDGFGNTIVDGYTALLDYWDSQPDLTDLRWLAYVLGTQEQEAAHRERPVKECLKTDDDRIARCLQSLIRRGIVKRSYWFKHANGNRYFGRGFVQITHGANYIKMGKKIGRGEDLYNDPNLTMQLPIATQIIYVGMVDGEFRRDRKGKHTLARHFPPGIQNRFQWQTARDIVNGGRFHAGIIAGFARTYFKALRYETVQADTTDDTAPPPDDGTDTGTAPPNEGNTPGDTGPDTPETVPDPDTDTGTETPDAGDGTDPATDPTDDGASGGDTGATDPDVDTDTGTETPNSDNVDAEDPANNVPDTDIDTGDGTTPPTDDGTTPPTDDGTTPPTDDGTTPPTDDGATPPTDDGTTPPTDDGTTPPTEDGTTPPTDDGATPPPDQETKKQPWWKRAWSKVKSTIWRWK